jgi:glutamate racemase
MNAFSPIGVFDSGIGGLSVWKELASMLPGESMIYLADSAHAPYGTKSKKYITERSRVITSFLVDKGCKLIVVACNTATGAAISALRREFDVPFIGVEPAVKPAALASKTGHIGVLATARTFKGEHFKRTSGMFAGAVEVHVQAGTGLVELIEAGLLKSRETHDLLEQYLRPMIDSGIDQLVLGCTHYPFLIPMIRNILPAGVNIIDPAPAVARQTRKVLENFSGLNPGPNSPVYQFFTTGDPGPLELILKQVAGNQCAEVIRTI